MTTPAVNILLVSLLSHGLVAAAISLAVSPLVWAEGTTLSCEGVNFLYPAGIGTGPAKREAANREITIDLPAMTAKLVRGDETRATRLARKHDTYQGFSLCPNGAIRADLC